ncbi:MAG: hypothetical protein GKS06_15725 [Acidobacteria bacterium]|nr:hypothetical protein [Acidobacteriota bacterium]
MSWYTNYVLALDAAGRSDAAMAAWREATSLGLQMPFEVSTVAHAQVNACRA